MESWEGFSAFGDYAELQHVCGILDEYLEEGADQPGMLDGFAGENSTLIDRLNRQYSATKKVCDDRRIGLFERTWMADVFRDLFCLLDTVVNQPALLSLHQGALLLGLHKVLIAAHEVHDDRSREELFASALEQGKQQGESAEKAKVSRRNADIVKCRGDQKQRDAFCRWAKGALEKGQMPATVDELQGMDGFDPAWSARSPQTLKKWAKAAGFSFKSGRPKKNK